MTRMKRLAVLGLALLAPLSAWAAASAGKVMMLTGTATAVGTDGQVRKLSKDAEVFSGDLVNSGPSSYVNLRFADGAFFLLRPDTRFQIEDYRYGEAAKPVAVTAAPKPADGKHKPSLREIVLASRFKGRHGKPIPETVLAQQFPAPPPAPAKPSADSNTASANLAGAAPIVTGQAQQSDDVATRAFFHLVKGGFRSVSGLIGKINHDDYRVTTPVATIGIRGTWYSARLCQGYCDDRNEILSDLRAAGGSAPTGNETIQVTTVEQGQIVVQTPEQTTIQPAGTVLLTVETGQITPIQGMPKIEQQERSLKPDACGQ